MKIALISINAHTKVLNFASPLHTYVFQQFLLDNGIKTTIVDYKTVYFKNFDVEHPLFYYIDHPCKDEAKQKDMLKRWKDFSTRERFATAALRSSLKNTTRKPKNATMPRCWTEKTWGLTATFASPT